MDPCPDSTKGPCFTSRMLDSLFFSMAVYEPTPEAVLADLQARFGYVRPVMEYGFGEDGKQAIFAARSSQGHIIIACRGTAGLKDVLQDLKYFQTRLKYARGTAHWGFAERAQSVPIDFFCKLLSSGEEIIFTGHSLGGAVASLLSLRVLEQSKGLYQQQVQCITFGSPLFASETLAKIINSSYKDVFIHVVSKRDCVPKILPVVSAIQRLLYSSEDHLEGLSVLRKCLECIKWLPVAALIRGIEQRIPSSLKLLLRCVMKLAWPSHMTGSYAFAGHVLMLDSDVKVERSLKFTSAEDLNIWHSQLNFALGAGFDVSMIQEHGLNYYHDGIVRVFSQVLVSHEVSTFTTRNCQPVESTCILLEEDEQCWRSYEAACKICQETWGECQQKHITIVLSRKPVCKELCSSLCEVHILSRNLNEKALPPSHSAKDVDQRQQYLHGEKDVSKELEYVQGSGPMKDGINSASVSIDQTFQLSTCSHNSSCGSKLNASLVSDVHQCKEKSLSLLLSQRDSGPECMSNSRVCLRGACFGASAHGNQGYYVGCNAMRLYSTKNGGCCAYAMSLVCAHPLEVPTHCATVPSGFTSKTGSHYETNESGALVVRSDKCLALYSLGGSFAGDSTTDVPLISNTCKMSSLVCQKLDGRKEVHQRRFRFGWFIGTIGRVARHLRTLDNLCIFTFVRIALGNILG